MKAHKARREPDDWNASFARKPTHGRLAHLQDGGQLARS